MLALRDHREPTRIGAGADSIVFRAWRLDNGQPEVLKVSRLAHPPAQVVARFEKEHALLASLDLDEVIRTRGLLDVDGQLVLLVEDFGGVDLARVLRAAPMDFPRALDIATRGAEALAQLHAAGILHKDVNPANLLYNARTGVVKLADLGLASRLPREAAALSQERALRGTVRYIAPEQTGRMNRAVDARSDLYSYGVTLYELFCGRPPFQELDRAALVHAHIALPPPAPRSIAPDLPEPIALIVTKLLEKDPDARYQAAATLARDLRRCRDAVQAGQPIAPFPLGQGDVDDRFRLSQVVVGRDRVLETLRGATAWLERPSPQALFVTGAPGIGKSALIGELQREVASLHGSFARGKFDERRRGVPYQGLLDALAGEVQALLRAGESELARFRKDWGQRVGANGQLVLDVLPSLTAVVGPQPATPTLSGAEERERFVHTFLRAVQSFSSGSRPLVLFVDDLQWADPASLELLGDLLTEPQTTHLLFIGAWRDGEVDEAHGVHRLQARLKSAEVAHESIHLGPLDLDAMGRLVGATLRQPPDAVADLARLVAQRTGGNPFFVGQLLEKLHRDGVVTFDHDARRWTWDLEGVARAAAVEDVGRLLAGRLDALPPETAAVLERAALLGHEVSLDGLVDLLDQPAAQLVAALEPAVQQGLVHAIETPTYAVEARDGRDHAVVTGGRWRFLHDRVQEAAYARLTDADRAGLHLQVARAMRADHDGPPETQPDLFDLLHHLDGALPTVTDPAERRGLATLYAAGAQRAVAAVAYRAAEDHATVGLGLLGPQGADTDHDTWFRLLSAKAWAQRAQGDLEGCHALFEEAKEGTRDLSEMQVFYAVLADLHASRSEAQQSFQVGLDALKVAGRPLPATANIPKVLLGLARTKLALGRRTTDDLYALPDCTDPDALVGIELLMRAAPSAIQTSPNHYPLIIFEMVRAHVKHGLCRQCCFSFAGYAVLLCAFGDVQGGLQWADLALKVRDRYDEKVLEAVLMASVYWNCEPWRRHLSECVPRLVQGARSGMDHGDVQFMGTCAGFSTMMTFYVGAQLDDVVASWEEWSPYYDRHGHAIGRSFGSLYRQLTHNLQEPVADPLALSGPFWDEAARIPELEEQKRFLELYLVWTGKALLAWYWGQPSQAADFAERAIALEQAAPSFPCHPHLHSVAAMGALASWEDRSPAQQKAALKRTKATLKMLMKHEARAPMNLTWRRLLVEAELARVEGRTAAAMTAWEAGIEAAQTHRYRADAGAASLRMATFLRDSGRERMARVFVADGWFLLRRWGAHARADALRLAEGWLQETPTKSSSSGMTVTLASVTSTEVADSLDADAVIKATQAISGELELQPLVTRLLEVCCETAGARRGAILLAEGDDLVVAGVQGIEWLERGTPLDDAAPLPPAPVRYVLRSGKPLVLDDAMAAGPFSDDADVQSSQLRSMMVAPLSRQGRVEGVVYLDNTLVAGAFTADRARMVSVLANQAALSVRNAQLFAEQRAQAEAFARFVPRDFLQSLGRDDVRAVERGDGVERDMAVMFTDLRGFTDLSEGMAPRDLMAFLNEHLGFMEPEISRHGGFIDKFIGDAILALFAEGAQSAVAAGVAMQQAHARFNARRRSAGQGAVGLGLGVHCGPLTLGTIGGKDRLSCTVLGDTVNLASRVESLTKTYGSPMLITDDTLRQLPDPDRFRMRSIDRVAVKGRQGSVELIEVLDALPREEADRRAAHAPLLAEARAAWTAGDFAAAAATARRILEADETDGPARNLASVAQSLVKRGAPDDWDGVLRLRHK